MKKYIFETKNDINILKGKYGILQNFEYNYSCDHIIFKNNRGDSEIKEIVNGIINIKCEFLPFFKKNLFKINDNIIIDKINQYKIISIKIFESDRQYISMNAYQ